MQYKTQSKIRLYIPPGMVWENAAQHMAEHEEHTSDTCHVIARDNAVKHVATHLRAIGDELNEEFSSQKNLWLRLFNMFSQRRQRI